MRVSNYIWHMSYDIWSKKYKQNNMNKKSWRKNFFLWWYSRWQICVYYSYHTNPFCLGFSVWIVIRHLKLKSDHSIGFLSITISQTMTFTLVIDNKWHLYNNQVGKVYIFPRMQAIIYYNFPPQNMYLNDHYIQGY